MLWPLLLPEVAPCILAAGTCASMLHEYNHPNVTPVPPSRGRGSCSTTLTHHFLIIFLPIAVLAAHNGFLAPEGSLRQREELCLDSALADLNQVLLALLHPLPDHG